MSSPVATLRYREEQTSIKFASNTFFFNFRRYDLLPLLVVIVNRVFETYIKITSSNGNIFRFVRGIHRSPANSPHKSRWRGAVMYPLIYKSWIKNRGAGDLRRHRVHYDVNVMMIALSYDKIRISVKISKQFANQYQQRSYFPIPYNTFVLFITPITLKSMDCLPFRWEITLYRVSKTDVPFIEWSTPSPPNAIHHFECCYGLVPPSSGLAWNHLPGMNGFIIWSRMLFKAKASYVAICHCKETVHPEIDAELL